MVSGGLGLGGSGPRHGGSSVFSLVADAGSHGSICIMGMVVGLFISYSVDSLG